MSVMLLTRLRGTRSAAQGSVVNIAGIDISAHVKLSSRGVRLDWGVHDGRVISLQEARALSIAIDRAAEAAGAPPLGVSGLVRAYLAAEVEIDVAGVAYSAAYRPDDPDALSRLEAAKAELVRARRALEQAVGL